MNNPVNEGAAGTTGPRQPQLGIQGPVVGWLDPWAGELSDTIMRTGTGRLVDSQDPPPSPAEFVGLLRDLGADLYVHHVLPGIDDHEALLDDLAAASIDIALGNEYGNINGPWVPGTNRWDVPQELIAGAAERGILAGVLYDEPEHLQINANQYRRNTWKPHFADTEGLDAAKAAERVSDSVRDVVERAERAATDGGQTTTAVPAELVFPVMFHTLARGGMAPCPKVMKESFHPIHLTTALGAALQYDREFWVCADLWGPDIGPWFTRAPGFPGHSPAEFAAALRMSYLLGPDRLFVENVDALARNETDGFRLSAFGEVWREFALDFVPNNPLSWSFRDATPTIALVHADDSNFGRGLKPFGDRSRSAPSASSSVFDAWHLLTHGASPAGGISYHIDGYSFPRVELDGVPRDQFPLAAGSDHETRVHTLFQPANNVAVFDEHVTSAALRSAQLIIAAGSRLPDKTLATLRAHAAAGATVLIGAWLAAGTRTEPLGDGRWFVTDSLLGDDAREIAEPFLGTSDRWTQRFGDVEVRITPDLGAVGGVNFEIITRARGNAPVGQIRRP